MLEYSTSIVPYGIVFSVFGQKLGGEGKDLNGVLSFGSLRRRALMGAPVRKTESSPTFIFTKLTSFLYSVMC
jgi:hypothetical protein